MDRCKYVAKSAAQTLSSLEEAVDGHDFYRVFLDEAEGLEEGLESLDEEEFDYVCDAVCESITVNRDILGEDFYEMTLEELAQDAIEEAVVVAEGAKDLAKKGAKAAGKAAGKAAAAAVGAAAAKKGMDVAKKKMKDRKKKKKKKKSKKESKEEGVYTEAATFEDIDVPREFLDGILSNKYLSLLMFSDGAMVQMANVRNRKVRTSGMTVATIKTDGTVKMTDYSGHSIPSSVEGDLRKAQKSLKKLAKNHDVRLQESTSTQANLTESSDLRERFERNQKVLNTLAEQKRQVTNVLIETSVGYILSHYLPAFDAIEGKRSFLSDLPDVSEVNDLELYKERVEEVYQEHAPEQREEKLDDADQIASGMGESGMELINRIMLYDQG